MLKNEKPASVCAAAFIALLTAGLTWYVIRGTALTGCRLALGIAGAAVLGGLGTWLCLTAQKKGWSARRLFLMLFVPLSLLMLLAMPIGRVPDEDSHLQRIWLLSEGQLFPSEAAPLT